MSESVTVGDSPTKWLTAIDDDLAFDALVPDSRRTTDRIRVLAALRAGVDALPVTVSTFKLDRVAPEDESVPYADSDTLLEFCGAWKLPARYAGGTSETSTTQRYVNPNYPHAHIYSDCFGACECGGVETTMQELVAATDADTDSDHADDCRSIWRWRASHEMWERRASTMGRLLERGIPPAHILARLGYERDDNLMSAPVDHDIDLQARRDRYRERVAHTAMANLHRYPPRVIADAFGYSSPNTIFNAIHDHFDGVDLRALAGVRRRNTGGGDA